MGYDFQKAELIPSFYSETVGAGNCRLGLLSRVRHSDFRIGRAPFVIDNSEGGEINFEWPKEEKVNRMLDEYYNLRRGDKNGIPTEKKLKELGLSNVAEDLKKMGKIEG
jgi:aldehyde:ferredoxin oxidoreductase